MDPKLTMEINENRMYVREPQRQDRDRGIKSFMLRWKPHSELLSGGVKENLHKHKLLKIRGEKQSSRGQGVRGI